VVARRDAADRQNGRKKSPARRGRSRDAGDFGFEKKSAESAEPPARFPTKEQTAPVVDPLRDYLAGWMTPADYALLVNRRKTGRRPAWDDFTAGLASLRC